MLNRHIRHYPLAASAMTGCARYIACGLPCTINAAANERTATLSEWPSGFDHDGVFFCLAVWFTSFSFSLEGGLNSHPHQPSIAPPTFFVAVVFRFSSFFRAFFCFPRDGMFLCVPTPGPPRPRARAYRRTRHMFLCLTMVRCTVCQYEANRKAGPLRFRWLP